MWFVYVVVLNKQGRPKRDVKTTMHGSPRLVHYGLINKHNLNVVFKKYSLLLYLREDNEK